MIRIFASMRKRSDGLFQLKYYNNYGNVIWGYGAFEVSYSVCVKIRFSGNILSFEYASLRSFSLSILLLIFFSLRLGLFDTGIDHYLNDFSKKNSFKNTLLN